MHVVFFCRKRKTITINTVAIKQQMVFKTSIAYQIIQTQQKKVEFSNEKRSQLLQGHIKIFNEGTYIPGMSYYGTILVCYM